MITTFVFDQNWTVTYKLVDGVQELLPPMNRTQTWTPQMEEEYNRLFREDRAEFRSHWFGPSGPQRETGGE